MTITDRDIPTQVERSIEGFAADFDIDGIVVEIVEEFGLVDIDSIADETYWTLVERHDNTPLSEQDVLNAFDRAGIEILPATRPNEVFDVAFDGGTVSFGSNGIADGKRWFIASVTDTDRQEVASISTNTLDELVARMQTWIS